MTIIRTKSSSLQSSQVHLVELSDETDYPTYGSNMRQWIPASAGMTPGTDASLIMRSLSKSASADASKCIVHPFETALL
jgi:hypothetical protein